MIVLLRILLIFMVFASSIQQNLVLKFNCEFKQLDYRYFHAIHTCKVRDDLYVHQKNIELQLRSYQVYVKIPAFSITNKSIFYLPKGIEIFFPNLEFFEVIQSSIKDISSQNLEPYPNLKYLDLSGNNIQSLESKLFQFNSKLEVLILNDNEITTVDQLTFYGLYSIKFLGFQRNRCFSDMTKDAGAVQNLIESIKFSCSEANDRHSMNIENLKKEVSKNCAEISNLKTSLASMMHENKNISNNKIVEGLKNQLIERQGRLETTLNQHITNLESRYQVLSANVATEKKELKGLINKGSQMIKGLTTEATGLNMQYKKLSSDLHRMNTSVFSEFNSILSGMDSDSLGENIRLTNPSTSNNLRFKFYDKLSEILIRKGIFTRISEFHEWVNKTINLVKTVDEVKQEIKDVKGVLASNISSIYNIIQKLDQNISNSNKFTQNSSILANIISLNSENLLSYLLISNITLIFLFLGIVIYLCSTRMSQSTIQTPKPLRIEPPTYRQLVESPTLTPLPTPLNLNHSSIYGQYEYIDEQVPITPAFEDFYSDDVRSVRNEERSVPSDTYAAVYRPDRY